jgi:hypothetical protein
MQTLIHKTTTPPTQKGHPALAGHQQLQSNIEGRAAPPLFLRREPNGKCALRVGQNLALVGLPKLARAFFVARSRAASAARTGGRAEAAPLLKRSGSQSQSERRR